MKLRKNLLTALFIVLCLMLVSCHKTVVDEEKNNQSETISETEGSEEILKHQIQSYLSEIFDEAYQPYYEGIYYEISDYKQEIEENEFSSEFLFTMWHLDSGGDISSEQGKKTRANFRLMVKGTYIGGQSAIDSVMMDVSPVGEPNYSVPIEECFPDENAVLSLVGYISRIDTADRKLVFDKLFFLTSFENEELLNQLGVSTEYLPNGYYLYNPEERFFEYEISEEVVCRRFEMHEDRSWLLTQTTLSTMAEALNTNTPLYDITVKNGVVTTISERYIP
ncbi:MAG: hypothetical protein E7621_00300 [Ruminococcaceae bacterium]|nr:hypothetical protein [Oscillospiraceae bacterium]